MPPCNYGLGTWGEHQLFLVVGLEMEGKHEEAWRAIVVDNPLPAIHGRCLLPPLRKRVLSVLSSTALCRFTPSSGSSGDLAIEKGWELSPPPAATGHRVLVVGAGPSGLSGRDHLVPGGVTTSRYATSGSSPCRTMRYGIPAYRLPRDVLSAELARIEALGVRFAVRTSSGGPCF